MKELEYKEITHFDFKLVISTKASKEALNSFIGSREVNDADSPHLPTFSKLKKLNKQIQIKYSANDLMAYKELVLHGLGIGLLPEPLIEEELKSKKLKAIHTNLKLSFPAFLVHHASYPLSHEANRMADVFKTTSQTFSRNR